MGSRDSKLESKDNIKAIASLVLSSDFEKLPTDFNHKKQT